MNKRKRQMRKRVNMNTNEQQLSDAAKETLHNATYNADGGEHVTDLESQPDPVVREPFVETPATLKLLAIMQQYNEVTLGEFAKRPSNIPPILLRRVTPDDDTPSPETPKAMLIVDVHAKPPALASYAVGPQIGAAVPALPGFFYSTVEAEKKYANGHVFTDGKGCRFKFISQETADEDGVKVIHYWVRTSHPPKPKEVK